MATKPTKVPVWNTGGANNTEPTAGKKILGWEASEPPPSSSFNWLQKLYGEWCAYLSDGDLSDDITLAGQLTLGPNYSVKLQGTGQYKRPSRLRHLAVTNGYQYTGTNCLRGTVGGLPNGRMIWAPATTGEDWIIPVAGINEGERIISINVTVDETLSGSAGPATDTAIISLYRCGLTSPAVQIATASSTGGVETVVATLGTPETITSTAYQYFIQIVCDGDTGGTVTIYDARVVTDAI